MKILSKKAALFGLDARIAFALFVILSTVVSATVYNVVRTAEANSILYNMRQLGKAYDKYYIDMREDLPREVSDKAAVNFAYKKMIPLIEKPTGRDHWKGPYVEYTEDPLGRTYRLSYPPFNYIYLITLTNEEIWGDTKDDSWYPLGKCSSGKRCSTWVMVNGLDDKKLVEKMDRIIEGVANGYKGNFRWFCDAAITNCHAFLKIRPEKNPYD